MEGSDVGSELGLTLAVTVGTGVIVGKKDILGLEDGLGVSWIPPH